MTTVKQAGFEHAVAINLAADTIAPPRFRAIWVGGLGNVKIDSTGGDIGVLFTAVPAGTMLWVQAAKIYSTANGTTATNLVGLYGSA